MTGIELIGLARISDREHQNTQSDLSRQEVFTQNVFDNLPLAIIVKKASDLTIVHVNLAAQEILGQQRYFL